MKELIDEKIYLALSTKYEELLLDYVLLSFDDETYYKIDSHKKAVTQAISILNKRVRVGNSLKHPDFFIEENKMYCIECDANTFFNETSDGWIVTGTTSGFSQTSEQMKMSYWRAFSDPPYGTPYTRDDFQKINHSLFPVKWGDNLDIYSWNDDFSNYFDDGKEWWGTAFWSIYDKCMNRFIIIGASLTD